MSLSKEQVEARRETIGASDIPAILGISKYKTARELYAEKNSTEPAEASEDKEDSSWGRILEPIIVGSWGIKYGVDVQRWITGPVHNTDASWATCTPDGWVRAVSSAESLDGKMHAGFGVEAKNRRFEHGWGPSGTEEIPPDVEAQVRWSMFVTGAEQWGVGVLIGGNNFRHYIIKRDRAWEEWVFPIVEAFREGSFVEDATWKPVTTSGKVRDADIEDESAMYAFLRAKAEKEKAEENALFWSNQVKARVGEDLGMKGEKFEAKLSPVKGRESTDWEAVARDMELLVIPESFTKAVEKHTHTGKPYRRLVVKEVKPKTTTTKETT